MVTGCYATRQPEDVATLPGVVRIVPNPRKERVLEAIASSFDLSTAEVIAATNAALASGNFEAQKNIFAALNEQGCPLS